MIDNVSRFILSHKGRIIISPNDERVAMILAWIYIVDKKTELKVYSYEKIKKTGLFRRVEVVFDKKDEDLLIVSDEKYNIFDT